MGTINSVQLNEEIYNVPDQKPHDENMFFYKGLVIGSFFSLIIWTVIFWAIT
ncbi:MAG: hypothetical protein JSW04_04390 [Desulfobacterales bacterium]|nr:MAG: hypothetical protein JSW04_04390 [Desulfobacterales bacterium]